jgi:hypothetical protein
MKPDEAWIQADLFGMTNASNIPFRRLLTHAWYAGLVVTALSMMLLGHDLAPALILMAMLPVVFLCQKRNGVLLTAVVATSLAGLGFFLSGQQDFSPWLRSEALTIMVLAPVVACAVLAPVVMEMEWKKMPEVIEIQVNQRSIISMSDSTSRETVGKVTPVTNCSKAA